MQQSRFEIVYFEIMWNNSNCFQIISTEIEKARFPKHFDTSTCSFTYTNTTTFVMLSLSCQCETENTEIYHIIMLKVLKSQDLML